MRNLKIGFRLRQGDSQGHPATAKSNAPPNPSGISRSTAIRTGLIHFLGSETCGADIVVGIDMENFTPEKKADVSAFIDHLADQLVVGQTFDQSQRSSARLSVFGFADSATEVRHPLTFEMLEDPDAVMGLSFVSQSPPI